MRFLIVTTNRDPMPPDMALPMMHMMRDWVAEHRASGKLEHVWSFAGMIGGGGIANVDTHEELDAMMGGFPFAQTSNVDVYTLADLEASMGDSIARMESIVAAMAATGGG